MSTRIMATSYVTVEVVDPKQLYEGCQELDRHVKRELSTSEQVGVVLGIGAGEVLRVALRDYGLELKAVYVPDEGISHLPEGP